MQNTEIKRKRIGRKKPVDNSDMTSKQQLSAVFELFMVEERGLFDEMLTSSANLMTVVNNLKSRRINMSKVEYVTFDKLIKTLEKCVDLEYEIGGFESVDSISPKLFLSVIESSDNESLKYETLIKKQKLAQEDFDAFIDDTNTDADVQAKTSMEIADFTKNLQKLISLKENYYFIESTSGFFCFEVLTEYHKRLIEIYEALGGDETND